MIIFRQASWSACKIISFFLLLKSKVMLKRTGMLQRLKYCQSISNIQISVLGMQRRAWLFSGALPGLSSILFTGILSTLKGKMGVRCCLHSLSMQWGDQWGWHFRSLCLIEGREIDQFPLSSPLTAPPHLVAKSVLSHWLLMPPLSSRKFYLNYWHLDDDICLDFWNRFWMKAL